MLQSRLSLITFDLDNTLWDSDAVIERAHQAMCAHILSACPGAAPWIGRGLRVPAVALRYAREHPGEEVAGASETP